MLFRSNSVSRVGGAAQTKAMKKVAGGLRVSLAQYRELEAFAAFGADLDKASRAQLDRGERLVELLKQPQYRPFPMEEQAVSIWAGTTGKLDEVPVVDIRRFEAEFLDYLRREHKEILDTIEETAALGDDTISSLEDALTSFKEQFETSEGKLLNEAEREALDEDEVEQEKIVKHVRKPAKQ